MTSRGQDAVAREVMPGRIEGCAADLMRRSGEAAELERRISAELSGDARADLSQVAFMMLKADAIAGGRTREVLDWLEANGLVLLDAWLCQTPRASLYQRLYHYNLTPENDDNVLDSWGVNCRLYLMGPSLGLLVSPRHPQQGFHAWLRDLKGASAPHLAGRGTLRGDLRAVNRTLNLVHAADDALASAREYDIFVGLPAFIQVIRDWRSGRDPAASAAVRVNAIVRSLGPQREELAISAVMHRIRMRCALAWSQADANVAPPAVWAALDAETAAPRPSDAVSEARQLLRTSRLLRLALTGARGPQADVLRRLAAPATLPAATAGDIVARLRAARAVSLRCESGGIPKSVMG